MSHPRSSCPVLGPAGKLLGYAGTLTEITWRKEAQREQERRTEELEDRVRERTAELREQTERLSEMNAALKVLLRQREEDRAELERIVLANVQSRIKPALDLLAGLGGERLWGISAGPRVCPPHPWFSAS